MKFTLLSFISCLWFAFGCQEAQNQDVALFDLEQVRLLDGPFLEAQQTDLRYMMAMDPDRLLAPFQEQAGLAPKKPHYENWEGIGLNGHIGGHYLSALSLMYASTGNDSLLTRLTYMLDELEKCQQANGNGYVGGIPDGMRIWKEVKDGNIQSNSFGLNGAWVPLYNIHKLFAGLRDAYLIAHQEKALVIWISLSDWMLATLNALSDEQIQEILKSEHGGINEVFADLHQVTGEKKYLDLAVRLSHKSLLDPLLLEKDELTGMHANTQIPKVIGFERIAQLSDLEWSKASEFFWNTVVTNRTTSFGGNSVREHFHKSDDFSAMLESEQGPETCNTYNMLRLSKLLFTRSGQAKYLDYYERSLYNHILSSQHPEGGFVYFTPIRPNHYRVYSKPDQDMWCCVGTGIENHGKYGELIYAHRGVNLLVNFFIPSVLTWEEQGLKLTQETNFPFEESTELVLELKHPGTFSISIRLPTWSPNPEILVNGKEVTPEIQKGYLKLSRKWKNADRIKLVLPMKATFELLPDSSAWGAYVYGPIVLAAQTDTTDLKGLWSDGSRMGQAPSGRFFSAQESPTLVTSGDPTGLISKQSTSGIRFQMNAEIYPSSYQNLTLVPFFQVHESRYVMYWPFVDSVGLATRLEEAREHEEELLKLNTITVDYVAAGEQQPESEHQFVGDWSWMGYSDDYYWRSTNRFISYELRNQEKEAAVLLVRLLPEVASSFSVYLNDQLISEEDHEPSTVPVVLTYDLSKYPSSDVLKLKFEAKPNSTISRLLDIRLCRRDP